MGDYFNFGKNLEQLRKKKGLSQQNVVDDLAIGSQATYSSWETGRTTPNFAFLVKLADYFSTTIDELIKRGSKPYPQLSNQEYTGGKTSYQIREREAVLEKDSIGRYIAKELIREGHALIMTGGTTTTEVFRCIIDQQKTEPHRLNILTNNLGIHTVWKNADPDAVDKIDLELTGGECDIDRNVLCGYIAEESVNKLFNPDMVILGTSGLSFAADNGGFYYRGTTSQRVITIAMLSKPTKHRIIACHHSKICQTSAFTACTPAELVANAQKTTVITTEPTEAEYTKEFEHQISLFNDLVAHLRKTVDHYHDDLFRLVLLNMESGDIQKSYP